MMNLFKKFGLRLNGVFALFFLFFASQAHAVYLIGQTDPSGTFSPLQEENERFRLAFDVLRHHEWPSPAEIGSETYDHWIRDKVKEACRERHLDCQNLQLVWVPQTVWDLSLILIDKTSRGSLLKKFHLPAKVEDLNWGTDPEVAQTMSSDLDYFAPLQKLVFDKLLDFNLRRPLPSEKLAEFPFVEFSSQLLQDAEFAPKGGTSQLRYHLENDVLLAKEKKENLFSIAIRMEIDAHNKNQVILWRATNGTTRPCGQTVSQEAPTSDNEVRKHEVIDFPAYFNDDGLFLTTRDLSFGHSLLAGYFFDRDDYKGACTLTYVRKWNATAQPSRFLYSIVLDRSLIHQSSRESGFSVGNISQWTQIFGKGEKFHSRTGLVHPTDQPGDGEFIKRTHEVSPKLHRQKSLAIAKALAENTTLIAMNGRMIDCTDSRDSQPIRDLKNNLECVLRYLEGNKIAQGDLD